MSKFLSTETLVELGDFVFIPNAFFPRIDDLWSAHDVMHHSVWRWMRAPAGENNYCKEGCTDRGRQKYLLSLHTMIPSKRNISSSTRRCTPC
jgi:hypothetical protein